MNATLKVLETKVYHPVEEHVPLPQPLGAHVEQNPSLAELSQPPSILLGASASSVVEDARSGEAFHQR